MTASDRREFLQQSAAGLASMAIVPELEDAARIWHPHRAVNVAVVGAGRQGREILAELSRFENVNVVAVVEPDARRRRRGIRRTKGAAEYADWKEMLGKHGDVTAAFVATPTHLHRDVALGFLEAGKHVYCEAPMASTVEDLRAMAKAAVGAKSKFQVGHHARSNPVYKLARSFYRSGSIERLVSMRCQSHRKSTWRVVSSDKVKERAFNWRLYSETSSGLPGEVGSHLVDTLHWFTKKTPRSVRGMGATLLHRDDREVPDTVLCTFDYGDGINLVLDATLANSYESEHALLCGTMGTIKLAGRYGWLFKEADAPVQGWEVYANRQQFHDEQGITLIADATKLASQGKLKEGIGLPHPELHYAVERFLQSCEEDKPVCCTALDGLRAGIIGVKAHEAVASGQEVALPEDLFKV